MYADNGDGVAEDQAQQGNQTRQGNQTGQSNQIGQSNQVQSDDLYLELAVEVFSMLADATRVRIVLALCDQELPVNQLAQLVGKSPSAVSQHLAKLRFARIVATRQEGQRVYYRLANEHAKRLVTDAIHQAEHAIDAHPAHHQFKPQHQAAPQQQAASQQLESGQAASEDTE